LYYKFRLLHASAEADECRIISDLTKDAPRSFVEFGFHPIEFNCVALAKNPEWRGLLNGPQPVAGRSWLFQKLDAGRLARSVLAHGD
jgi:hypothetical protein